MSSITSAPYWLASRGCQIETLADCVAAIRRKADGLRWHRRVFPNAWRRDVAATLTMNDDAMMLRLLAGDYRRMVRS